MMVMVIVSAVAFVSNDGRGRCIRHGLCNSHSRCGHCDRRGCRDSRGHCC